MALISFVFVPFLAVMALLLGAYYLAAGVKALIAGETAAALFLIVFGISGIAMSLALWRIRRGIKAQRRPGAVAPPAND